MAAQKDWRERHEEHCREYRAQVRKTMQAFSDQALRFQDSIIVGGIDREECDREILIRFVQLERKRAEDEQV